MLGEHRQELIEDCKTHACKDDPAHDFNHLYRVLNLVETIAKTEGGDRDILIPAALFHDIVNYAKDDPKAKNAAFESGQWTKALLESKTWYPQEKVPAVVKAITHCSFSKNLPKETIEEHILQDADLLESIGTIAIARAFVSGGKMNRPIYCLDDPPAIARGLDPLQYTLDVFPQRLFVIKNRIYTKTAQKIAEKKDLITREFYANFIAEISGNA